ncbi:biotin-dependent carboxyltransferase family protein [Gluconobacter cerinus]|uniref:5-oxoprolinase subunit C family protein n=1 Tax=Gluconobacter cerinus TaxID=38307 RepID=UPI0039E88E4E
MLRITECGPLNTIQDAGRFGVRHLGIGVTGPMDPVSFRIGNRLVGNDESVAAIEIQTYPFAVEISETCRISVTGAGRACLNDVLLPPFWSGCVGRGQTLQVVFGGGGARGYLCVSGGISVPPVLGSTSTHLRSSFGGFKGRDLQIGDDLIVETRKTDFSCDLPDFGILFPEVGFFRDPQQDAKTLVIRALRGMEYDLFTAEAHALFWSESWKITQLSNRTGYRFSGPTLSMKHAVEMRSHGVLPGVVQVPPAGQPIVQMVDGNTVGGYPKLAHVIDADMYRLGQASSGQKIIFKEVSYKEAVLAHQEVERNIQNIRDHIGKTVSSY